MNPKPLLTKLEDRVYKGNAAAKKREYHEREKLFGKKGEVFGKLGAASRVRRP